MAKATQKIIVVGAGMGGLSAAALLAARGLEVTVVEQALHPGGKMREVLIDGVGIDSGPTVFTMRWALEAIFEEAGGALERDVGLVRAGILARHAWNDQGHLDLHSEEAASRDAIAAFAGAAEGRAFAEFAAEAGRIYRTLKAPFLEGGRTTPWGLASRVMNGRASLDRLGDLLALKPFDTMWSALDRHFKDPRLRQLFGRYATYVGASPFRAPATLMLIAHVEQDGVWLVEGGMARFAEAMQRLGERAGARFRFGEAVGEVLVERGRCAGVRLANGERIEADAVVLNADPAALPAGLFGANAKKAVSAFPRAQRAQSAVTWSMRAGTSGFPLTRHSVFFSDDYRAEFDDVFGRGRPPRAPTVYVCAQDRGDGPPAISGPERLFVLVNAPPTGDAAPLSEAEIAACEASTFNRLEACGLKLQRDPQRSVRTTPAEFNRLFPATGGALYGRASHGWAASFLRPGARTALPGLYLAGGSVHPGPGVPMAALSGRTAARTLIADLVSTHTSRPAVIPGGISTRPATTDALG